MPTQSIPYSETGYFSKTICDYLQAHPALEPFYHRFPNVDAFKDQIQEKQGQQNLTPKWRTVLKKTLGEAYSGFKITKSTQHNINLLEDAKTFTITTGHQLNLFTGPLYFLYKIVSVINLAKQLKEAYPEYNFVPVYWMATEDHDFDEINYFNYKGKKLQWNREASGAVGELNNNGLEYIHKAFSEILGPGKVAAELATLFKNAYLKHDNLANATRYIGNTLFGNEGLVVVDGNSGSLKRAFIPYAKLELTKQQGHDQITKTTAKLVDAGYSEQVHPREINLFYIISGIRERIVAKEGGFVVNNTQLQFSKGEMLEELENFPERFSPNALLRPLFQEVILPNLCYVGGGGELAYWLQLKDYFNSVQVVFPMLLLRNSALLVNKQQEAKIQKLGLQTQDLFLKQPEMQKLLVKSHSKLTIDFSNQKQFLKEQFKALYDVAKATDASFIGAVAAQEKKQLNGLAHLEKRLLKAEKRKLTDLVSRATRLQDQMFPKQSLQERNCNFSEFYLEQGASLITILLEQLDPLSGEFTVITI